MSTTVRLLLVLCCGVLPAPISVADDGRDSASAIERAVAVCHGDQQCEATVRKREILATEKRQKREAADDALKASDPAKYYLMVAGRLATVLLLIGGGAGLYVLVMHLLFGKRKRRAKGQTDFPD